MDWNGIVQGGSCSQPLRQQGGRRPLWKTPYSSSRTTTEANRIFLLLFRYKIQLLDPSSISTEKGRDMLAVRVKRALELQSIATTSQSFPKSHLLVAKASGSIANTGRPHL